MMTAVGVVCSRARCIGCGSCLVACSDGADRSFSHRRLVSLDWGNGRAKTISVSCHHCREAACAAVCPSGAIHQTVDGRVLVNRHRCIGCGYCAMACPLGVPQFPEAKVGGMRGAMAKCTLCSDGQKDSGKPDDGQSLYQEEKKPERLPRCVAVCVTRALEKGGEAVLAFTGGPSTTKEG